MEAENPMPMELRRCLRKRTTLALLAVALGSANVGGQPVSIVKIGDEPVCAACSISIKRLAQLGDDDGNGALIREPLRMTIDGLGRYWVMVGGELPQIYDARGRFLQIIGRRGAGPGELGDPHAVVAIPGDSVIVLDLNPRRMTVVDPQLRMSRIVSNEYPFSTVLALEWPGLLWMSGMSYTPALAGLPLHIAAAGDAVVLRRSFAPDSEELRPLQGPLMIQALAEGRSGTVWSSYTVRYQISEWARDGQLQRSIVRDASWFPSGVRPTTGGPRVPPTPRILGLFEEENGLLWVVGWKAARTYSEAWPDMTGQGRELDIRSIRTHKLFTSVVEVIDTRVGRVVTRRLLDDWIVAVLPGGKIATYHEDASDVGRVVVSQLSLNGRE